MPRILNVNLPKNKATFIGLTYIKGIGLSRSKIICAKLGIDENILLGNLSKDTVKALTDFIDNYYIVGSKLTRAKITNIKNLIKMSSYRGFRHVKGLPSRGQRTHTNAKTSRNFKVKL
jgi:small subunit ribosomal protein S13